MNLIEIKKAHEADVKNEPSLCPEDFIPILDREAALIRLLEACVPFIQRNTAYLCDCGNIGYYVVHGNGGWGEPEQEQCEFCYTRPESEFNRKELLRQLTANQP